MKKLIAALLIIATAARAETPQQFVAARLAAGEQNAAAVHAAMLAPSTVTVTTTNIVTKPADILAWEQNAAAEITAFMAAVTGNSTNAVQRVRNLDTPQVLVAVRSAKGTGAAARDGLVDKTDALLLLYLHAQRKGYPWPLPAHFGQATYTETRVTTAPGPSWWARTQGEAPAPTVEQVREWMR